MEKHRKLAKGAVFWLGRDVSGGLFAGLRAAGGAGHGLVAPDDGVQVGMDQFKQVDLRGIGGPVRLRAR